MIEPPSRRAFLELSAGAAALAIAPACSRREPPAPVADPAVVRVASVPTAVEGDLLPALVHDISCFIRTVDSSMWSMN